MLAEDKAKSILAKLLGMSGSFSFPLDVYLGFLIGPPTYNAQTNTWSVTEPTCNGDNGSYSRVKLTDNGVRQYSSGDSRPDGYTVDDCNKILSKVDIQNQTVEITKHKENNVTETIIDSTPRHVARVTNLTQNIIFPYTGNNGSGYSGQITHFGIFGSATGSDLWFWGELASPVTVGANVVPIILEGKLEITLG